jgi:hypothetical protein
MFKFLWWVQLLNRLEDFDDILNGSDGIEDDLDFILLYLIPYLQPFQNGGRLNVWGGCNFQTDWWIWNEILYGDDVQGDLDATFFHLVALTIT